MASLGHNQLIILAIFFRVASLALGQSHDGPSASEATLKNMGKYLYYNYEKYPLSPLKPRSLVLIEQYLPNISDPVYSVHQSFMWFLRLNWRKSTFYLVTALSGSKCWPIVTSSIQEPVTSNCDVTMTDCSRMVAMDAFLAQWWGQWSQHRGRPRTSLALISLLFLAATKQL